MKRVIITGGNGLLGRALASELIDAGYQVIALSRDPSRVRGMARAVRVEKWDGKTAREWGALADGAFAILNFAGASIGFPPIPWWLPGRKENIMQSRVHAGNAIVDAVRAAKTKPRVVMQMSGSNFYGLRGDQSIAENETAGNDFPARVCVEWENATNEIESLGVRRVIARTAPVLTKRGGVLFYLALPFKFFVGGALGNGKQWFAWIHVADFIAAIRFLLENENARGAFNLAAPNPLINSDFARALARILKRPNWFPAPGWIFKFVFGELGETMVLGSQRVIPRRLQAMGFQFQFADAASALQDLLKEK